MHDNNDSQDTRSNNKLLLIKFDKFFELIPQLHCSHKNILCFHCIFSYINSNIFYSKDNYPSINVANSWSDIPISWWIISNLQSLWTTIILKKIDYRRNTNNHNSSCICHFIPNRLSQYLLTPISNSDHSQCNINLIYHHRY